MKFMNVIKKFKNQQDVVNFRDSLLDKAEELLNSGEMEQYKEQMEDVKTFDNEYKEYIEAQANMAALRGTTSMENVISAQGKQDTVDTINAAWLFLIFFGTLHSDFYIFPFLFAFRFSSFHSYL